MNCPECGTIFWCAYDLGGLCLSCYAKSVGVNQFELLERMEPARQRGIRRLVQRVRQWIGR